MPSNPQLKAEVRELQTQAQSLRQALQDSEARYSERVEAAKAESARADELADRLWKAETTVKRLRETTTPNSEVERVRKELRDKEAMVERLKDQVRAEKAKPPVIKKETVTRRVPADTSQLEYKLKQTERERDKWRSLAKK